MKLSFERAFQHSVVRAYPPRLVWLSSVVNWFTDLSLSMFFCFLHVSLVHPSCLVAASFLILSRLLMNSVHESFSSKSRSCQVTDMLLVKGGAAGETGNSASGYFSLFSGALFYSSGGRRKVFVYEVNCDWKDLCDMRGRAQETPTTSLLLETSPSAGQRQTGVI